MTITKYDLQKFNEMTDSEIKEAVKDLKTIIKSNKITYTHANPLENYCYISSGSVPGVYFPNSEISIAGSKDYSDFVCIAKYGGDIGIVCEINEEKIKDTALARWYTKYDFEFATLTSYIYNYDELRILENIEKRKKEALKDLSLLQNIEYITTKAGQPFARLENNINPNPKENIKINVTLDKYYKMLRIHKSEYKISKYGNQYNDYHTITLYDIVGVDSLKEQVTKTILSRQNDIKNLDADIKSIKTIGKKIQEVKKFINQFTYGTQSEIKQLF